MEKIIRENGFLDWYIDGDGIEIKRIFVNEKERHKGIGTEMLGELIEIAKNLKIKKIITYSSTNPEKEVFGKFLIVSGFTRLNTANSIGNKWELAV